MTTTTQKTLKQIKLEGGKAIINGHAWDIGFTVGGQEVVLTRTIRVKAHFRRLSEYHASNTRHISIRRPIDFIIAQAS
jgi:hypothetical protein